MPVLTERDYTEILRHRYAITEFTMTMGTEHEIDPAHIGSIQFEYDYLRRRLPIIKVSISLTDEQVRSMYENKDTAKVSIEILDNALDDTDNIISSVPLIHDTYDIIPATGSDDYTGEKYTDSLEEDPNFTVMSIYLIKNERIQWLDKKIATIFKNTDKAAAIQSLFSMRDIPAKTCVITPPVTNDVIDSLVLPLGDLVENIDTLNTQYGLWSSTTIIFDDYTYLYCIDRNNPNVILSRSTDFDTIMFKVPSDENAMLVAYGSGDDAVNRCHYVNLAISPSIEDNTNTTTKMEFGTITSIDSDGKVKKYTVDENSPKMKFVRATSDITINQFVNNKLANPVNVTITATDISVGIFRPYKNYRFDVEEVNTMYDTLANRVFRLSFCNITLTKKQNYFESLVNVQLSVVDDTTAITNG